MKNKYCILDLETTSLHSFKRFCNPFDKRNKMVVVATLLQDCDPDLLYSKEGIKDPNLPLELCNFIVGHNLKFDLSYIWDHKPLQEWLRQGGKVWDTMTAAYLLSAQLHKYPSLDELTEQYGGEVKDDRVTEMFKAGFGADEIDEDILLPYAEGDVINTEVILQGQGREAKLKGMKPIILAHMEHYLALTEMECNGLYFDLNRAHELREEYEINLEKVREKLLRCAAWTVRLDYNPDSDEHNSAVLFNTTVTVVEDTKLKGEDGEYLRYGPKAQRAGEIKTRKEKIQHKNQGYNLNPNMSGSRPLKKEGLYSTDVKVLRCIIEQYEPKMSKDSVALYVVEFCKLLIEYRETTKFLSTYLYSTKQINKTREEETGLIPLVQPIDGCIHHSLDTVQTRTGRLNSKNPNGQNIPRDLLQLFTSRYGDDGVIVAVDYSQLEVRVQAYLTQSDQMIQDIKDGLDFHALRLSYAVDKPYEDVVQLIEESEEWKLKRKKAKTISFEKAYGASPQKIANTTKLPIETVNTIFRKEDERYPEVEEFYKEVTEEIKKTRVPTDKLLFIRDKRTGDTITRPGYYQGIGYYTSITGKKYHFYEKAVLTKYNDVFTYFSPPDIFNYPVQGLAADIVSLQVGKLFRFMLNHRDKGLLINEVHDEVVLDMKKEYLDELLPQIKTILEDVDGSFQEYFGCRFNVPVEVDISYGRSWGDCK